ncbi:MAG TPA: ATP-binding protein [Syntrophomonadaceae bacterium]|nr:ATP-binding protein [Syntrophomonadaceae bacterium]
MNTAARILAFEPPGTYSTPLEDPYLDFKTILSSLEEALLVVDVQGMVSFMNPAAEQITGYRKEEAIGQPIHHIYRLFDESTMEPVDTPPATMIRQNSGAAFRRQIGLINKVGESRSITDSATVLQNEDGHRIGMLIVFNDITESRRLEEERAHRQLRSVLGQMAAGIAHEIRNPITAVYGFLELLKINRDFGRYPEYFEIMRAELDQMNSSITALLSLARGHGMEMMETNLNQIIHEIAPRINAEAALNHQELQWQLGDIPNTMLNQDEIAQMVLHLVRNGLDATPMGGRLDLRTYRRDSQVVLAVQDYGQGISENVLRRLGTPFLTTKETGLGLGLVICQSIAEKHQAAITVETGEGGTTFTVCFNGLSG